jgi:signal transduction histidine kinase
MLSGTWVVVALLGIVGITARDAWIFLIIDYSERLAHSHLSQFTGVFILLCLFGHLSHRFVSALKESESLNKELEQRVMQKAEELAIMYDRSLRLEVAESASREREKIYRDLHDDVGSKLVSIIHSERSAGAPQLARSALESLRAAIFQAKNSDLSLKELFVEIEEETQLRAEASSKSVQWSERINNQNIALPEPGHYHLARIIREAVSNSLRAANEFSVSITLDENQLQIFVANPSPIEMSHHTTGSGVENIQFRAAEIGAIVDWQFDQEVLTFCLTLNISAPLDAETVQV